MSLPIRFLEAATARTGAKKIWPRLPRQVIAPGWLLEEAQDGDFLELGAQELGECPHFCRYMPGRRVNRIDLRRRRRVFGENCLQPALFHLLQDQPVRRDGDAKIAEHPLPDRLAVVGSEVARDLYPDLAVRPLERPLVAGR